jgi:hypothetical protein
MVASRWPLRLLPAALISRSTSFSVRCSRVLRALLGKRRGTVRFRLAGAARLRCVFSMGNLTTRYMSVGSIGRNELTRTSVRAIDGQSIRLSTLRATPRRKARRAHRPSLDSPPPSIIGPEILGKNPPEKILFGAIGDPSSPPVLAGRPNIQRRLSSASSTASSKA